MPDRKGLNAFAQYLQDSTSGSGYKTSFGSFKSIFNLKHLNNLEQAMYTTYNT